MTQALAISKRFWSHVKLGSPLDCWIWRASCTTSGYGQFVLYHGRPMQAHRYSYEEMYGPLPQGYELNHLCRNKPCVNPGHVHPVTRKEHVQITMASNGGHWCSRITHCPQGHPYSPENTRINKEGARVCRICNRKNSLAYKNKLK